MLPNYLLAWLGVAANMVKKVEIIFLKQDYCGFLSF